MELTPPPTGGASARHLAPAGCRVAARGEPAGFIFTTDCTLRWRGRLWQLKVGSDARAAGSATRSDRVAEPASANGPYGPSAVARPALAPQQGLGEARAMRPDSRAVRPAPGCQG